MGKGLVEELKKDFQIEDRWISYELHPETPSEGILLTQRFPGADLEGMFNRLRTMGEPFGITFGAVSLLSNSRPALEASEYARDRGLYDVFHENIFRAYMTDGRDIGDIDVVVDTARSCDLDADELRAALEDHRYAPRLEEARQEGAKLGINAVPTFIIEDSVRVVGAQSVDAFKSRLKSISTG